jgi:hypothetical protein
MKYSVLAALLGATSAINIEENLEMPNMPGMPSLDVAPLDGPEHMEVHVEPPKPVEPAGPKSICEGQFAAMYVIPGWNADHPHTNTPDECLDRCEKDDKCKVIVFHKSTGWCWAGTSYSGACINYKHNSDS